jgi:Fic family protein
MISYHFSRTKEIEQHLLDIEAIKIVFEQQKYLPQVEEKIRRLSLLKSSLYSARIEGNPLHLSDTNSLDSTDQYKIEVSNLLKAYEYLNFQTVTKNISVEIIRDLHQKVMSNLSSTAGKFRQEPWAIFDQSGNAIHLAPPYFDIPKLMNEYVAYLINLTEHPCITSAISQFIIEKIHPFADGNGRAGRLVSAYILKQSNYHLRGMIPFEEYTDNHRQAYYYALEPSTDMTEFVEYFLNSLVVTSKSILEQLKNHPTSTPSLPFRRQEIFDIISDHPNCSFDFLQRRFSRVNPKTLHYDLKKLLDLGIIVKIGATRGALYRKAA